MKHCSNYFLLLWRFFCPIASLKFKIPTWVVGIILFNTNHNITNPSQFWSPVTQLHSKCCFSKSKCWKLALEMWAWIPFEIISRLTLAKKDWVASIVSCRINGKNHMVIWAIIIITWPLKTISLLLHVLQFQELIDVNMLTTLAPGFLGSQILIVIANQPYFAVSSFM